MNVRYHRSKDGGKTFETFNAPHGDHHDLWIAPEDNQRMIIADDGGGQVSFDGGENWTHIGDRIKKEKFGGRNSRETPEMWKNVT